MPDSAPGQSAELLRRADDIDDILPQTAAMYGFRITGTLTPAESPARHSSDKWERYASLPLPNHTLTGHGANATACAGLLCRWEIALPPMVDTAHKPEDAPGGGSGYVQFSLAWAMGWDQHTRDRILVEKDATPGGPDGLAAAVAYAVTHNQPARLTKVCTFQSFFNSLAHIRVCGQMIEDPAQVPSGCSIEGLRPRAVGRRSRGSPSVGHGIYGTLGCKCDQHLCPVGRSLGCGCQQNDLAVNELARHGLFLRGEKRNVSALLIRLCKTGQLFSPPPRPRPLHDDDADETDADTKSMEVVPTVVAAEAEVQQPFLSLCVRVVLTSADGCVV
jgi:hypothetical protein